jgi:Cu/Ag efflux pump CusA
VQAQFLIPMAVTITFGLLFGTLLVLLLVPALYGILADITHLLPRGSQKTAPDQLRQP